MYSNEATTGGILASDYEKKKLAIQSKNDPEIKKIFGSDLKMNQEKEGNDAAKWEEVKKEEGNEGNEKATKKKERIFLVMSLLVFLVCYLVIKMGWMI